MQKQTISNEKVIKALREDRIAREKKRSQRSEDPFYNQEVESMDEVFGSAIDPTLGPVPRISRGGVNY